jgi:hypothetical protein
MIILRHYISDWMERLRLNTKVWDTIGVLWSRIEPVYTCIRSSCASRLFDAVLYMGSYLINCSIDFKTKLRSQSMLPYEASWKLLHSATTGLLCWIQQLQLCIYHVCPPHRPTCEIWRCRCCSGVWCHLQPWRWRQYVSPKHWYVPMRLHGVTTQKSNIDSTYFSY